VAGFLGDQGTNKISNIAKTIVCMQLQGFASFGLCNAPEIKCIARVENTYGYYGKMAEVSKGKDSTISHREIAGIIAQQKFPLYPKDFSKSVLEMFLHITGIVFSAGRAYSPAA